MREALALARADLGPTALVLSTSLVAVAGPRGWFGARDVEMTAATDGPAPAKVSGGRLISRILRHKGVSHDEDAPVATAATLAGRVLGEPTIAGALR